MDMKHDFAKFRSGFHSILKSPPSVGLELANTDI